MCWLSPPFAQKSQLVSRTTHVETQIKTEENAKKENRPATKKTDLLQEEASQESAKSSDVKETRSLNRTTDTNKNRNRTKDATPAMEANSLYTESEDFVVRIVTQHTINTVNAHSSAKLIVIHTKNKVFHLRNCNHKI